MSALNQGPAFLDRAAHLRDKTEELKKLFLDANVLQVFKGKVRADDRALLYSTSSELPVGESYFLGIDPSSQIAYFAHTVSEGDESEFKTAREIGPSLSGIDLEIALTSVALSNWHHAHPRCSKCGAPTRSDLGGFVRICDIDETQHHPRTDGAVIVLVKDSNDRILLGHNPNWPEKRYSTFAGFLEPGETFEQCVAREVREEAHVDVREIEYLGSQPWPFPASIMIAFDAIATNPESAQADGVEITDVRWFSRDQLKTAVENGEVLLPPDIAVARKMINRWYGEDGRALIGGGESWR